MVKGSPRTPLGTLTFRLGVLGAMQEAQYAAGLARYELKPKHVALLSALRLGGAESQQELAAALRIAPSLVVLLADQLESLGAVQRVRDGNDRRRQRLEVTPAGLDLLDAGTAVAAALDEELAAGLGKADRVSLERILRKLAVQRGLPESGEAI
jgi:DNA-binding MarR family transcriptional regulator